MLFCRVCPEEGIKPCCFETEAELHKHLRSHKIKINDYYLKYFARKDLFTKELLPFKNTESYFGTDFLNRKNCIDYLVQVPKTELLTELKRIFIHRKEYKKLEFAPCQVELKSSPLPNINFFSKNGVDYKEFCKSVGLISRYDYNIKSLEFEPDQNMEWLIDSREQLPLKFGKDKTLVTSLDSGDYVCKSHFKNIFIDRKSAADFIGTFAQTDRFEREIERAKSIGSYLIVICEMPLEKMLNFDKENFLNKNIRFKPEFIFYNIKKIINQYNNIQFLFVNGRPDMVRVMRKIYLSRLDIRNYDLQWVYERGIL